MSIFKIKKLYVLVLRAYLGPFVLTFCIVTFLLLMQFLWRYIEDLIGKGLDFFTVSKLLIYTSASLVPMALPLAVLLAALMTFGNLGENNELMSIKAAGVSLQRIMKPLITLIVVLCIGAFYFSNYVIPFANLKMRSLLYDIQRKRPEFQIKEGVFYNDIEGYSIKIKDKDSKTKALHDIIIYDHTANKGNSRVTIADSGYMRMTADGSKLVVTLFDGCNYEEMEEQKNKQQNTYPHRKDIFKEQELILDMSGFGMHRTDENLFKSHYKMLNIYQLEEQNDSLKKKLRKEKSNFSQTLVTDLLAINDKQEKNDKKDEPDIKSNDDLMKVGFDSLYNSISAFNKTRVLTHALNHARRTKGFIAREKDKIDWQKERVRKYQIEWHRKFTLSFACFIFFFIGAPLGAIIRKGGLGMPVVISVLFFIIYYVVSLTGEKMVREFIFSPFVGMWISSMILLPLGVFLTYKATTDSVIMNTDTYINFVKKYFNPISAIRMLRIFSLKKAGLLLKIKKHKADI